MDVLRKFIPYFKFVKPVRIQFALGIVFGVLFSLTSGFGIPLMIETAFPILFGNPDQAPDWLIRLVDQYFKDDIDGGFLILCSMMIPFMMAIRAMAGWANGFFMNYTGFYLIQKMQKQIFSKIQVLPYSFFKENKTGEITASILAYPEQIKRVIVDMSNDIVKQPLTLFAALGFIIYKSTTSDSFFVAFIGFLSIPILVFPIRMIGNYLSKRSTQIVQLGEALTSWVIETVQSPIEIRSFNLEGRQKKHFFETLDRIFKFTVKSVRTSLLITPSIEFVSSIGFGLALYLGVQNGMSQGEFLALFIALYMAYGPIKRLGQMHGLIKQIEPPLDRVDRILNLEESVKSPEDPIKITKPIKGFIEFKDVSFEYEPDIPVLKSVNISVGRADPLAIVGDSGSGKSSLVNLLMRLYDPYAGVIEIDGIDLRKYCLRDLRDQISYVPQMPLLFNCSAFENIRIGRSEASDDEVFNATKRANAYDFIKNLPNGFDTIIGEKGNLLSGGQKQRIAIARALLKDAPIMIFDEATSALDESKSQDIIKNITEDRDKTILFISHDTEVIKNFTRTIHI